MKTLSIPAKGIVNALATVIYIAAVSLFLYSAGNLFGAGDPNEMLVSISMLSLLVLSAAVTGLLVFGRPITLYLGGSKKEAFKLLVWTIGSLFAITVVFFLILLIV